MLKIMWNRATRYFVTAWALALLVGTQPNITHAKEFDVTGTLDCGVKSGSKCEYQDWEIGPRIGMLTRDISGNLDRVIVDAAWIRDDLSDFGQDDFVWFTVEDLGTSLQVTSVLQHRCMDGRLAQGSVNDGRSSGARCHLDAERSE